MKEITMSRFLFLGICGATLALSGCDEVAVAGDPAALSDLRGGKSCIAAVKKQTGSKSVTLNTTIPIVELNRYVVNVAGANAWT